MDQKLKCGIEIHQRLNTPTKLFCKCENRLSEEEEPSALIKRKLRAVAGELGQTDPAAAFEAGRTREFTYQTFPHTCCLVEQDEEPPAQISEEAMTAALTFSLLLESRVLDEIHVMRKTVVDGSATTGFQRTALIALNGKVKTQGGNVGVPTVCLEEESSGIIEQKAESASYRLDRLGVPLIEIATEPTITSGKQAREVAYAIGLMLRSASSMVKRGLGTIRQDLNVSVEGGARCEVKGVQDLDSLEAIVENEAARQRWLLWIRDELVKRKAPRGQKLACKSVYGELAQSQSNIFRNAVEKRMSIMAAKLEGFSGLLGKELMPNHRLGTELSDYAKAYAGVTGILHSDEDLTKYGLNATEVKAVENALGCTASDAFIICIGATEEQAVRAIEAALKRAIATFDGVPKETRKAVGTLSKYMRPLPGSARMYPETDVTPYCVDPEKISQLTKNLPKSLEEQAKDLQKLGLSQLVAWEMANNEYRPVFDNAVLKTKVEPVFIASTLLQTIKALKREGLQTENISQDDLLSLFEMLAKDEITKAGLNEALRQVAQSGVPAAHAIKALHLEKLPYKKVVEIAKREKEFEAIMRQYRLVVSPDDVKKALSEK